jgi:hypothetical protein
MSRKWQIPTDTAICERLSAIYGFPIPLPLAPLIRLALQRDGVDNREHNRKPDPVSFITVFDFMFEFDTRFERVLHKRRTLPHRLRYIATSPEYFALTWLGVDGISRGYLVHTPELAHPDYPIVEFQPVSNDGLMLLGATTRSGLEASLSRELAWWMSSDKGFSPRRPKWEAILRRISTKYDIQPNPHKDPPISARFVPEIPHGWRYEPTIDGVGVLAPATAFSPYPPVIADWNEPLQPVIQSAQRALDDGYPATALHGLRATYHHYASLHPKQHPHMRRLLKLWQAAYILLERPLLATVIQREILPLWSEKRAKE